jgi:integrase
MASITYNVRLWKMEVYHGAHVTTYRVRWTTDGKPWRQSFRSKAQAVSFEASLRSAASRGAAFDASTGRPLSWARADVTVSWYDFCVAYVDMKWRSSSAHHRANIAWTLVTVMPAMITSDRGRPESLAMRTALRQWAFNSKRRGETPDKAVAILDWLSRNTKPVTSLADAATARALLEAAGTLLDGRPASPSTVRRNRTILHNAMEYAVERRLLATNPVKDIKWKAPRTNHEVDRRSVVSHRQARRLFDAVREQAPSGERLVAFYAVIYYAALRPEEAVSLRTADLDLPALVQNLETGMWEEPTDNWGELRFCTAATEVGAEWTDDGDRREHRQLKARAPGEWRHVPCPPPLTRLLRSHLDSFGTGRDGRIISGVHHGELASVTYRRVWDRARRVALTPAEYSSPLARRVYDLRHACVSTWLNGGVPPAQVADWAGHSVAVLLRIYAKCIDGQAELAKKRIEEALRESDQCFEQEPGNGP